MQRDVGSLHRGHSRKVLPHEDHTQWSPIHPGAGVLEGFAVAQCPLEASVRLPERDQRGILRILYELDRTGAHGFAVRHLSLLSPRLSYKYQRAGKRLKSIQVPAFQVCEQGLSFFFARALRMILRRWRAST